MHIFSPQQLLRRRLVMSGLLTAATGASISRAHAQAQEQAHDPAYPTRPVTLIVPGPAGGTPDAVAREVSGLLKNELGQTVIVDNRAGANGNIGVLATTRSAPDGYTLLMGFAQTMALNPVTFKKLPYDPVKDFVPIARLVEFDLALAIPASVPATNMAELIKWLKANSGKAAFGSFGGGTPSQFAGEMFNRKAELNVVHVPYKGSAPLLTDLIGGQVQYGFLVSQAVQPYIKSGKLRVIAVTGEHRSPTMPSVPTMKELGFDDAVAGGWYGLFAPKGTPQGIVAKLDKATAAVMKSASMKDFAVAQDLSLGYQNGTAFGDFQQAEIARWRAIAIRTNFQAEE